MSNFEKSHNCTVTHLVWFSCTFEIVNDLYFKVEASY